MKPVFSFLLSLACLLPSTAMAQQAFKVLAVAGKSTCNTKVLGVGNTLSATDNVAVAPKSYLSLIHRSGGTVQISTETKPLERSVSNLEENLKKRRYLSYVISEGNHAESKHKYINVLAAIERRDEALPVLLPQHSQLYAPVFQVKWQEIGAEKGYVLEVLDFENHLLKSFTTQQTTLTLDARTFIPAEAETFSFIVKVKPQGKGQEAPKGAAITWVQGSERLRFESALQAFHPELTGTGNAYDLVSEALFFENHGFLIEALERYDALLQLKNIPDEDRAVYLTAYNMFLERNQIEARPSF